MKRTGIIQPGIKIECEGVLCGECRFKKERNRYLECQFMDIICLLYNKLNCSIDIHLYNKLLRENRLKIKRLPECLTCEVLYDEKRGYVPYK